MIKLTWDPYFQDHLHIQMSHWRFLRSNHHYITHHTYSSLPITIWLCWNWINFICLPLAPHNYSLLNSQLWTLNNLSQTKPSNKSVKISRPIKFQTLNSRKIFFWILSIYLLITNGCILTSSKFNIILYLL